MGELTDFEDFKDLIAFNEGINCTLFDREETTSDTQMPPPLDGSWGYSQQAHMTDYDPGQLACDNPVGKIPQQPTLASTLVGFSHEYITDITSFGPVTPKATQELVEAPMPVQEQFGTTNIEQQQHMNVLHHGADRDAAHPPPSVGEEREENKPKKLKKYEEDVSCADKQEKFKIMNAQKAKANREKKKQEINKLMERNSRFQEELKEKDLEMTRLTQKMNQDEDRLSQVISRQSQEINRLRQENENEKQEKHRLSQENSRLSEENNRLSQEIIRCRNYEAAARLNLEPYENCLFKKLLD